MSPNILVVDDSPTVRNVLKTYLLNLKMRCMDAQDANHALQLLHKSPADLAIVDINMPGMDGIEFVRELRNNAPPHLRDIPVVLITAEKDDALRQQGLAAGANDFVHKPVSSDALRAVVKKLLPSALRDA